MPGLKCFAPTRKATAKSCFNPESKIADEAPIAALKLVGLEHAQVAQLLGVDETDVMASLQKGDLKGKQIGTQWRVPRAAVDAFLHS